MRIVKEPYGQQTCESRALTDGTRVKRLDRSNFTAVKMRGLADRGGGESENAINPTIVVRQASAFFSDG